MPYFAPLYSLRTLKAKAILQANPRYRNSAEADCVKNVPQVPALEVDVQWNDFWEVLGWCCYWIFLLRDGCYGYAGYRRCVDPLQDFCESFHRIGEYSGCTCPHLPLSICNPPALRKEDANRAILAARMAFSSFEILSRVR